jgi:hypothetical protein
MTDGSWKMTVHARTVRCSNYRRGTMDGQISIFDFISELPESAEEMARLIGNATGLVFNNFDYQEWWKAKKKGITYEVHYSHFSPKLECKRAGKKHISLNVTYSSRGGYGIPCDSIDDAVYYIKRTMKAQEEGKVK